MVKIQLKFHPPSPRTCFDRLIACVAVSGGHGCSHHDGACADAHGGVRHVIGMSVADENHVPHATSAALNPSGGKMLPRSKLRVEQENLALVGQFEISKARPSDGKRLRTLRKIAAGRDQDGIVAADRPIAHTRARKQK